MENEQDPETIIRHLHTTKSDFVDIVLIGGGHCNAQVIRDFYQYEQKFSLNNAKIRKTVISNLDESWYSGMIPGVIARQYSINQPIINLPVLCERNKTLFIRAEVTRVDVNTKQIWTKEYPNDHISYDLLSINVGSTVKNIHLLPDISNIITTRPIHMLVEKLEQFESEFKTKLGESSRDTPLQVVVVGGGAAGVELSFTIQKRFCNLCDKGTEITLLASTDKLLSEMGSWVSSKITSILHSKGIKVFLNSRVTDMQNSTIQYVKENDISNIKFDLLIWSTGASPLPLLKNISVELDADGWILVNTFLQSVSSQFVFAVGDCCSIQGYPYVAKAGVYSVREGPIVTHNLALLAKYLIECRESNISDAKGLDTISLLQYVPQKSFLALINTGDFKAISCYKGVPLHASSMWTFKDHIDQKFVKSFDVQNKS